MRLINRNKNIRYKKIAKVFESAPEMLFDDTSKLVFMSDCHRGDGGGADVFYPNRNIYVMALNYYALGGFTYVELGDGDELWKTRRFSQIQEAYSKIFENLAALYKEGRFLCAVGNHDMVKKKPKWVREHMNVGEGEHSVELYPGITFPMGLVFKHRETGWKIHAFHGHQVDPLNDDFWKVSRFLVQYVWRPLGFVGVNNPLSAAGSPKKKKSVAEDLARWAAKENVMVIAGHTHLEAFPKPGESRYFNDGCCVHKEVVTSIEIVSGTIALIKWSVECDDQGVLKVARTVAKGPEALAGYFV
ncbi:MAG: serine/threonine protein phosphatase [Peptococcaceae bacterium]|nr:serine/threonine protein phosphatase [Peptococcaceae bacterium]